MAQEHRNQPQPNQSEKNRPEKSQTQSMTTRSGERELTREPSRFGTGSPFALMRRFNEEMERFFDDFFGSTQTYGLTRSGRGDTWWPDMEVFDRDGKIVVRAELSGMKRDDVRVEVRDDQLCISGERRHEQEHSEGSYYTQERQYGSFCRTIPLPAGANADTISATFKDGLLTIEIEAPERKNRSQRQIEVREGESH